jgi:hypothetical protein
MSAHTDVKSRPVTSASPASQLPAAVDASRAGFCETLSVSPDDRAHLTDGPCDAYLLLRNLEIVLRELVIVQFTILGEERWWKRRVPNDVQQTARRGLDYQRSTRWLDASTYHPIYYTDFADIRKILTSRDNWLEVFSQLLYNKDQLGADLQSLEPLRNTIAHSRTLSPSALEVLRAVCKKIRTSLGSDQWDSLQKQQTVVHAAEVLPAVLSVLSNARHVLHFCRTVELADAVGASEQWWWDPDVLGGPLQDTNRALQVLNEYNLLPRGRGQGHLLEAWTRDNGTIESIDAALAELEAIIMGRR